MKNLLLTFILCLLGVQTTLVANNTPLTGVVGNDRSPEAPVTLVSSVSILNPDTIRICAGDTILLEQTNDCNDENLAWSTQFPGAGFIDAQNQPSVRAIPTVSQFYIVTTGPNGGPVASDSVFVDVDNLVIPEIISDTTICQGYPLQLLVTPVDDPQQTLYTWSPGIDYLSDSTDVNSIFTSTNDQDTVFTLIATAANGACADTQKVDVTIIRSELNILAEDTIFRCLGDEVLAIEVSVDPFLDPGSGDVMWSPTTGAVSAPVGVTYNVDPAGNVVYYAEGVVNGCAQIDSVAVRIDSLPPDMSFTIDPIKDPYCQGDTFTIQSPTYDVGDYPLITHEWLVAPGIASPQDLYNAVVFASDSALFTRVNLNGGCGDTTFTQINVIKPPLLIFDPENPMVCPGEELQINVSFDPSGPSGTLEWEDPVGGTLSCDDCLDPIATVNGPVTYMITVTAEGSECTSPASYTIQTLSDVEPILNDDVLLCPGDSRLLITSGDLPGYTYQISGGGIMSEDPNVQVTPAATTTYTVTTIGLCETFSSEITLEVIEDYTVSIDGPAVICPGESVQLLASNSANRNGDYVWTRPNAPDATSTAINTNVPGLYTVVFSDRVGCSSATTTYELIVVGTDFSVDIVATNLDGVVIPTTSGALPTQSVVLTAIVTPPDLNVTYEWSGNFSPSSGMDNPFQVVVPGSDNLMPDEQLNYSVVVTTVEGGCPADDDIDLNIIQAIVKTPDVITPNGDGTNDFFKIFYTQTADVEDFTLSIFNRWGQKIYTSNDIDEGWDGTVNGTPQNMDTYLFVAKFRINGEEREEEGQFSLIR